MNKKGEKVQSILNKARLYGVYFLSSLMTWEREIEGLLSESRERRIGGETKTKKYSKMIFPKLD